MTEEIDWGLLEASPELDTPDSPTTLKDEIPVDEKSDLKVLKEEEEGDWDDGAKENIPAPVTIIPGEPWTCASCGKEESFNDETCTFCGKDRRSTDGEKFLHQTEEDKDTYFQAVKKLDIEGRPEPVDPEDEPTNVEKVAIKETEHEKDDPEDAPDGVNEEELYSYWVSKEAITVATMSHEEIEARILHHMTNQRVLTNYYNRRKKKSRAQEFADRLIYKEVFEKLPIEIQKRATFEADIKYQVKTKMRKRKVGKRARGKSPEEKLYDSLIAIGIPGNVAREKSGWAE